MDEHYDTPAPIGAQIRGLRTDRNMTLRELAEEVGTSIPTMHRYEGLWEGFNLRTLRRIAEALDSDLVVELRPRDRTTSADPRSKAISSSAMLAGVQELFWDVEIREDQLQELAGWVLSRVMSEGDLEQARLALDYYGREVIQESLGRRDLSGKARTFLTAYLKEQT